MFDRLKNWHILMNLVLAVLLLAWPAGHDYLVSHPEIVAMVLAAMNGVLGVLTHGKVQLVDDASVEQPKV